MNIVMKVIVTEVKESEKRDYVSFVDLENGGNFSVAVEKGAAKDLPKLTPVEVVARAKAGRHGLSFEQFALKS